MNLQFLWMMLVFGGLLFFMQRQQRKQQAKRQEQMAKTVTSVIGQIGREAGRQLTRGLFGLLKK